MLIDHSWAIPSWNQERDGEQSTLTGKDIQ